MGSTAMGVAVVYPMQMEKIQITLMKNVVEVLLASRKALTLEQVAARLPGAADMVVVDSILCELTIRGDVRCQTEDCKDGKYERRYSVDPPVGKWLIPNEDGVSVAAPGISIVAPGGHSLAILREPQREEWVVDMEGSADMLRKKVYIDTRPTDVIIPATTTRYTYYADATSSRAVLRKLEALYKTKK